MSSLVSAQRLKERLGQPGLKVLDASWYMPAQARDGKAEYQASRIPGALFFDIDGISNPNTDLPHMLPTEGGFEAAMDTLGISNTDQVVLYDGMGIFSAPRAWWTFKVFGHDQVAVLDGGLPAWKAVGGEVDSVPAKEEAMMAATKAAREVQAPNAGPLPPATRYKAKLDASKVRDVTAMLANTRTQVEQVVDARSPGRFVGTEPEPRPGLKGGHIPGAKNLPFPTVLDQGKYKPSDQLAAAFKGAGIDLLQPLVGSCGSGLTACILALAAHQVTGNVISIYDGSWSEWGAMPDVPIATK